MMMKKFIVLAGLVVLSVISLSQAEVRYTVTDLGLFGGNRSYASSINDSGQIVGDIYYSGSNHRAFLYDGASMRDIGTLGGTYTIAYCINNSGQIVGDSHHAFIYDGAEMKDLGTLGGSWSAAYGINDNGMVVGWSYTGNSARHAFFSDGTTMQDIGTLGGSESTAWSINNSGQIVGDSFIGEGFTPHAFLYDGTEMHDLGTLGTGRSYAYDINNSGQVVGKSSTTKTITDAKVETHAFLYEGTTMKDLGTLGGGYSNAFAINDSGQVVGYSKVTFYNRAFLYDKIEGMLDLNDLISLESGWTLTIASDINSSGQIIGSGVIDGETHACLLTPIVESVIPVADAGKDLTLSADGECGASVVLDGSGSSDEDGSELTYHWFYEGQLFGEGVELEVVLGLDEHAFTLIVNNGSNDSLPDEVIITITDNTPPQVNVSMEPSVIWPPNKKMVKVTPSFEATDNCSGESTVELVGITCNQKSDGDIEKTDDGIFLRATRIGKKKEGRVYTITYKITDESGNETIASVEVKVPHDLRKQK